MIFKIERIPYVLIPKKGHYWVLVWLGKRIIIKGVGR